MNKIFKVIWSKTKNCYIVASEIAKNRTKVSKSYMFNKTLVAGILACILNLGIMIPVNAATTVADLGYAYTVGISGLGSPNLDALLRAVGNGEISFYHTPNSITLYPYNNIGGFSTTTKGLYVVTDSAGNNSYYAIGYGYVSSASDDDDVNYALYKLTNAEADSMAGSGGIETLISSSSGTTYTAGNGISISSDNKIYV